MTTINSNHNSHNVKADKFQQQFLLRLAIYLGLIFGIILLLFYWRNVIATKAAETAKNINTVVERNTVIDQIEKLTKEKIEALPYLISLQAMFPEESNLLDLEATLKNLAKQRNIVLTFNFGNVVSATETEPANYGFNLVATGHINNLLQWLEDVENLKISFRFDKIELLQNLPTNISTSTPISAAYDLKITGRLYFRENTENKSGN